MDVFVTGPPHSDARVSRRFALQQCFAMAGLALTGEAFSGDERLSRGGDEVLVEWGTATPHTTARHVQLRVFSSGLIESWPAGAGGCCRELRSPEDAKRLAEAFRKVIRDQKLTTDAILSELQAESRRTGLSYAIAAADDSIISIATDKERTELRCPAAGLLAERFPAAASLQAFVTLEQRAANLSSVVQCGGQDEAKKLCAAANERLLAEHPDAAAWTIDDLMMVRPHRDGSRFVQFRRPDEPGGPSSTGEDWTTCLFESPGRPVRVTVIPPAGRVR